LYRLIYIVCSDELPWVRSNIRSERFPVVHCDGDSTIDLAVLASCDHVITSTGTFSWWAGYLATTGRRRAGGKDGMVVYYAGFPPPDTEIGFNFHPSDLYPPTWIGLK
jgi:galactoside 2-L-fucosyltransferase 1/2